MACKFYAVLVGEVWEVSTTIYGPKKQIRHFLNLGYKIVVVADQKTPENEWNSNFIENLRCIRYLKGEIDATESF